MAPAFAGDDDHLYSDDMTASKDDYLIRPDPLDPRLTERVTGVDQTGQAIETRVTVERALTIFLNSQEIVTAMTINDYPEYLALGYLLNQHMLLPDDVVTGVDYDEELAVVVVRTKRKTNYEKKLKKKVQTSGCAQGTVFGDLMEALENVTLPQAQLRTSWLYTLTHKINTTPSLYLEAGAIHGCVLAYEDTPLIQWGAIAGRKTFWRPERSAWLATQPGPPPRTRSKIFGPSETGHWNSTSVASRRGPYGRNGALSRHFERDPIPYALETDWPAGAAGFEPLHREIRGGCASD